jgi:hypothetical protein
LGRLLATLAALTGLLLPLLGLSAPTAVMLLPAHALFSVLVCAGSMLHGWRGHPDLARRWGLAYLVATALCIASLEVGALVRGAALAYWGLPWIALLAWGWVPPVVSGGAGVLGGLRERRLTGRVVRRRRRGLREA